MAKKYLLVLLTALVLLVGVFLVRPRSASSPLKNNSLRQNKPPTAIPGETLIPPLSRAGERVTKKPFGIFITPQNSPVQPERFQGYHTGADFEIFPSELNLPVTVRAICSGTLIYKNYVSGYGGVVVESCILNNQPVTVLYGHLKLSSVSLTTGDKLSAGDNLGILGAANTSETDGERKHLHLSIHQGTSLELRGYVQNQSELHSFLNPCILICHN